MIAAGSEAMIADDEKALLARFPAKGDLDDLIPKLARDREAMREIEAVVQRRQTGHDLIHGNARSASALEENSVPFVIPPPPYWTLKRYHEHEDQLGHVGDYESFIAALDEVWRNCYRALVPGGRLVINVGDVC